MGAVIARKRLHCATTATIYAVSGCGFENEPDEFRLFPATIIDVVSTADVSDKRTAVN
jgi:hypothetical protein